MPTPEAGSTTDALGRPLEDLPQEARRGHDASDPEKVKEQKREAGRRERADADVLRRVMHNPEGRDWLYRQLVACSIFGEPFVAGHPDVTAHNLGRQSHGKALMMQAQRASLDLYGQMMKEQFEKERRSDEA